jgi:hypothetical protein
VCPSLVITTFPYDQGMFMQKHLADEIAEQRGRKGKDIFALLDSIKQEITIYGLD